MGKKFSEMTDEELQKEYLTLHDIIYKIDCFGTSDMINFQAIEHELEKRGYIIEESVKVRFVKK